MSLYARVTAAPPDPILGIPDLVKADTHERKANLGVGVYQDATGKLPLLDCVRQAEQRLAADPRPRGYLPMDGDPTFNALTQALVFGADNPEVASGRIVTAQALAGTGALKLGATFLFGYDPGATVLYSDPTWDNHETIFSGAGLKTGTYRYYDAARRGVDFDGLMEDLERAARGTVVVLHDCCHNPTGYDLTDEQWPQVLDLVGSRGLIAFLDMAYQGFAVSEDDDPYPVRLAASMGIDFLCANSYSKTFGLYGERIGALSVSCADAEEAERVRSRLKLAARATYSNPPTHGMAIVSTVLGDPELRALWADELVAMRERIKAMRAALVEALHAAGVDDDLSFITSQRGMFSYSGLSAAQMATLRADWGVYGVDNGRLCMAALNEGNLDYVSAALAAVWHA